MAQKGEEELWYLHGVNAAVTPQELCIAVCIVWGTPRMAQHVRTPGWRTLGSHGL